jgi:hypothetical protein
LLEGQLTVLDEDDRRIKEIGYWVDSEVVWLDELYDLAERFPNIDQMNLMTFLGIGPAPTSMANGKKVTHKGELTLEVSTRTDTLVDRLINEYTKDRHFIDVPAKKPLRTGGGRGGMQQFGAKLTLNPQPPSEYMLQLHAPKPELPKDQDDADADGDVAQQGGER